MSLLRRITSGDNLRKSRLHDEKGNFATWKNVFLHGAPAAATGLLRISTGYRPVLPWIAYTSIGFLKCFLNKRSRVLEFGSGMSTVWYAKNTGEVYSVEDYKPWYDKVKEIIAAKGIDNVTYSFAENETEYTSFMKDDNTGFDLIMVDGSHRSKCIQNTTELLRPGGLLYLDNSDKDSGARGGDMRAAEHLVRNFAAQSNAGIVEITDFAPTQFFVQQGLYVRLPA